MRTLVFLLAIIPFLFQSVSACWMSSANWEDSLSRVKTDFDKAHFVVIAKVIDVRTVYQVAPASPDIKIKLERATFRVERSFKGKFQSGYTFSIYSGISNCAVGVKDFDLIYNLSGTKARSAHDYPKRWLIYYTGDSGKPTPYVAASNLPPPPPPFEITVSSLTRPVEYAQYDLRILKKMDPR